MLSRMACFCPRRCEFQNRSTLIPRASSQASRTASSLLLNRVAVPETVQLNIQTGFEAEEIQDVRSKWMLSPELVAGETPVAQPTPKQSLCPRVPLAQRSGDGRLFGRLHEGCLFACSGCWKFGRPVPPHPGPLPRGEGGMLGSVSSESSALRNVRETECARSLSLRERAGVRGNGRRIRMPQSPLRECSYSAFTRVLAFSSA